MSESYNILSDKQKRARYDSGQDLEEHGMDFGGNVMLFSVTLHFAFLLYIN